MKPDDMRTTGGLVMTFATLTLAACGEMSQDAVKPFAGKEETQSYAGAPFKGDKALYERTLAERAKTQNEYLVTGGAK